MLIQKGNPVRAMYLTPLQLSEAYQALLLLALPPRSRTLLYVMHRVEECVFILFLFLFLFYYFFYCHDSSAVALCTEFKSFPLASLSLFLFLSLFLSLSLSHTQRIYVLVAQIRREITGEYNRARVPSRSAYYYHKRALIEP